MESYKEKPVGLNTIYVHTIVHIVTAPVVTLHMVYTYYYSTNHIGVNGSNTSIG